MTKSAGTLELDLRRTDRGVIVTIRGSAGIDESEKIRAELEKLASESPSFIVLDLSKMDFICSEGLGAIIHGHLKLRKCKGSIRLVNPTEMVRQMLQTTRLDQLFPIYPDVDSALQD